MIDVQAMRVLIVHNFYQQAGGEDKCVEAEIAMLREFGHEVIEYYQHNNSIAAMRSIDLALRTIWNQKTYDELRHLIRAHNPGIVHFHNTFPLISPSGYYAARAEGLPTIQTLHNFRHVCPNALFFRNGRTCEDCLGSWAQLPAIVNNCYRDSRSATTVVVAMNNIHKVLGTDKRTVSAYITLTEFSRRKLIEGARIPPQKITVKPNFLHPDPGVGGGSGGYALYVGRLSPEKGLETLIATWERPGNIIPLKIVGDGPMADMVRDAAAKQPLIHWLGHLPFDRTQELIGEATFLVMPSVWYETFGRVIMEAFAKGTPVIASRLGAMAELVDDGRTGLLFDPGDSDDLAAKIDELLSNESRLGLIRAAARQEYVIRYSIESNYKALMTIYKRATQAGAIVS